MGGLRWNGFRGTGLRNTILTGTLVVALGAAIAGVLGSTAFTVGIAPNAMTGAGATAPVPKNPRWTEIAWPFPMDQWGLGHAYQCGVAACGTQVTVYLRAKVGFCNCATGVSDDMELDRIADLEVFSDEWVPLAEGRPVTVGTMAGRSRPYRVQVRYASPITAISVGFNDKCDVAVATVVADRDKLAEAERLALAFLNTDLVLAWAGREIGL
jgi:hypothetical protein